MNLVPDIKKTLQQNRKSYSKYIKILLGIVWLLLFAIIVNGAWTYKLQLWNYFRQANYLYFLSCGIWYLMALGCAALNWIIIIRSFDRRVNWWTHLRIYLTTLAARRLPGTLWYIGGRVYLYRQLGISWITISVASGIEMVLEIVLGVILGLLLLPFGLKLPPSEWIPLSIIGLIGSLALHPKILTRLMQRIGKTLPIGIKASQSIYWFLTYMGLKLASGMMITQMIQAFQPITYTQTIIVIGAWAVASAAGTLTVFLPSSFGFTELTFTALLSTFIPITLSATIAILIRLLTTLAEMIVGGLFYLILKNSSDLHLDITNTSHLVDVP